jgi:membrane-associated protease RseP (regulator of RpoE activity)
MINAIGVVAFVVALLLSVTIHEAGHFTTARWFGMKASKFFVGFGPTLWSRTRGETEYGVKAIPAGGFVKIEGMTQLEEIDPADSDRAFYKQPAPQRAVVLAAGSFMHFVLALVVIFIVVAAAGIPKLSQNTVGGTSCVQTTVSAATDLTNCAGSAAAPAKTAGLEPGDRVVSFDRAPVTSWAAFTQLVRDHGPGTATIVVRRGDRTLTLYPDLVAVKRDRATGGPGNDTVGALGIFQGTQTTHYNVATAVPESFRIIGSGVSGTYDALVHRVGHLRNLFNNKRDPNGFVGVVGAARAGGDLLSAQGESAGDRVASFALLVAGVNLAVGLFNLLPLFPLDGGHLAVLGFEQLRQGLRRLRGYRGATQRVDLVKLLPATYAVVAVLVVVSVLVLSADIVNPIRINQ